MYNSSKKKKENETNFYKTVVGKCFKRRKMNVQEDKCNVCETEEELEKQVGICFWENVLCRL